MKNLILIISSIFFIVLIISNVILIENNVRYKTTNERLNKNITVIGNDNYTLQLTNKELKNFIKIKDTNYKKQIDSILKDNKIKIDKLKSLQIVKIIDIDTVPIYVQFKDTLKKNDSIYQKTFKTSRKCVSVSGTVYSKDISTNVRIDSIIGSNNIYIIKSYKKSFWDYIFFRKGKLVETIESDCGNPTNSQIEVIK